jgi:hypothetical protein
MPLLSADGTTQQIQPPGAGPYLLVNTDTAASVYLGPQRPVTTADIALPPQASVSLDGTLPWYASTLDAGTIVACALLPGGQNWNNPVGVQIALDTLGLAKDATLAALPGQLQQLGIPPFIPNAQPFGAVDLGPSGSPHQIVPAQAADTFIWYAHLSFAGSSNASHVGNDQMYAMLSTGSGKPLVPTEIAVGDAASADSDSAQLTIGGVLLAAGDSINLDVNSGNVVTDVEFRAACVVILGTP